MALMAKNLEDDLGGHSGHSTMIISTKLPNGSQWIQSTMMGFSHPISQSANQPSQLMAAAVPLSPHLDLLCTLRLETNSVSA